MQLSRVAGPIPVHTRAAIIPYDLLALERGFSALGEADHHPFHSIFARKNLRQQRGELFFGGARPPGLCHARVRERPLDSKRRLLCDQVLGPWLGISPRSNLTFRSLANGLGQLKLWSALKDSLPSNADSLLYSSPAVLPNLT